MSTRFKVAADQTKPYGSHRFDAFSPKLGRPIFIFGRSALNAWIHIESTPAITSYCERAFVIPKIKRVIDFWVKSNEGEQFWLLLSSSELDKDFLPDLAPDLKQWVAHSSIPVRLIRPGDLPDNKLLRDNWGSIIRDLAAFGSLLDRKFLESMRAALSKPCDLSALERQFHEHDPILVRVAVFSLLYRGLALCRTLSEGRISSTTEIEAI